jgi:hypothetical protein
MGELGVSLTQGMYQNLGKRQDRGDDAEVVLVYGAKKPTKMGKITGILFR